MIDLQICLFYKSSPDISKYPHEFDHRLVAHLKVSLKVQHLHIFVQFSFSSSVRWLLPLQLSVLGTHTQPSALSISAINDGLQKIAAGFLHLDVRAFLPSGEKTAVLLIQV